MGKVLGNDSDSYTIPNSPISLKQLNCIVLPKYERKTYFIKIIKNVIYSVYNACMQGVIRLSVKI